MEVSRRSAPSSSTWMHYGSPIWGHYDVDMFSRSRESSAVADEEAAVWWELSQRYSLGNDGSGEEGRRNQIHHEVDVRKMGLAERHDFIERILKEEEDNEAFLKRLRSRIDRAGIILPTVEVRFEKITVNANCYVGSRALPTLLNEIANASESILSFLGMRSAQMKEIKILRDVSGIIRPSRMTLLLGPPSSGKTTLLLTLAGKLHPSLERKGEVTYNGYKLNEFVPQKTATYISQNDLHAGEMTVKETLEFSARCQGVGDRYALLSELIRRERAQGIIPNHDVDLFMKATSMEGVQSRFQTEYTMRVTSAKDQEQYWADKCKPYRFIPIREFVEYFKQSHFSRDLQSGLSIPFNKSKSHRAALVFNKCSVPLKELLKASFGREWLLIKRNSFVYIFKLTHVLLIALIYSSVFLRKMHTVTETDGALHIGALLYGLILNIFNSFAEQSLAIMRLRVFFKQRDLLFYPTWVFTLPNCIIRIPISVLETGVWVFVTYYIVGFAPESSRLFKQFLIIFLAQQMAAGLFRLVAGLARHMTTGNMSTCIIAITLFAVSGFVLPQGLLPKWCMLVYWLSPLTYAFNSIVINEMFSPRWMEKFAPDGRRLGVAVLQNFDLFTDEIWYWKSASVLLAYGIFFNILFTLTVKHVHPLSKPNSIILEEPEVEIKSRSFDLNEGKNLEIKNHFESASTRSGTPDWHSCDGYNSVTNRTSFGIGLSLPFEPLSMSFKELNYYVNVPQGQGVTGNKIQLLRGVSGAFRQGILTALMGESGAGKTTLMDVLAGRKTGGQVDGDIWIAGYAKKQSTFARISGYCEQFDIHSPQLTVEESLIFSAMLRLPKEVSREEKFKFVDVVMELVELNILKNALVGVPGVTGLSTEQRKRLTIAVELVANPSIIFMDEPTSGLDARAAAIVMRTVRNTVNTGRTVVCTIHQPSIDIFESFDELLLLKRGGQVIYAGPLGQSSQKLIDYFESIPGVQRIKDGSNPAAWMLEVSSVMNESRLGIDFAEIYKSSTLCKRNMALVNELSTPFDGTSDLYFPTKYPQSSFGQLKICLWKYWSIHWRYPEYNISRLGSTLIIALILGSVFWRIGRRRSSSVDLYSVIGAMYLSVLFVGFCNCATVQPFVANERTVYYREKAAGLYSALPYALSQVLVELPYVFFQAIYYTFIIYSMMCFQWTMNKFLGFFIISFLSLLYFTYYGMLMMAISPNVHAAGIFGTSFFYIFHLFSGFFIPRTVRSSDRHVVFSAKRNQEYTKSARALSLSLSLSLPLSL
ncbi:hypothetical protein HPP92_006044 [Vanilla planifolia]|uniref:ABC transporter domain-containing protein n=1 Tax=Vanilla planifolia TaxID=51239 RepID=A0A835RMI2_VANPL|nr:hypothetical protein HPP92_006044 [Vanilla planifolia]